VRIYARSQQPQPRTGTHSAGHWGADLPVRTHGPATSAQRTFRCNAIEAAYDDGHPGMVGP